MMVSMDDMTFDEVQLDFQDVLIVPEGSDPDVNHRGDVEIAADFGPLNIVAIPVMSANMTQTGTFAVAQKLLENSYLASLHKFYSAKDILTWIGKNNIIDTSNLFVTVGLRNSDAEIQKIKTLKKSGIRYNILIDMPNAAIPNAHSYIKEIRKLVDDDTAIAVGNVATGKETENLIKSGADIVKVGIGPSQVCDTRIKTGCGRPQLSTIIECANVAHEYGRYVIGDGGYNCNGDICRALVAGADICMSGSLFAGCDEAAGNVITKYFRTNECVPGDMFGPDGLPLSYNNVVEQKKFKEYYGMSSFRAQRENYGETTQFGTSEGVESKLVPYTGPIQNTINDINGSLRSCGTYIGANDIEKFSILGRLCRVNRVK